ncbi:MAG: sensor histidine kinase [Flavobacteriaceae bacterium]|jgi:two-component system, OmpR family, phosphate regulon sensor histidine kinase PhoR|nr:sensor histidine kinase [Flavobacteriaceae bacterium]MBT3920522.1 sensor histidine kinase [Flavobacteriaceae bacterium]MBT6704971.1 sensor histidine kinase [Flavobacteriaceae bacterium]MBT7242932.1 sensor histidine kinase [Flavobacteriaceae bacterium]
MVRIFKKTYKFAFFTSILITIILSLINGIYFFVTYSFYISEVIIVFLVSFFIIQYRVENFIYKRMEKIYDDVSLLDGSTLGRQKITTNMETLTKEVELFARNKKLEIEALKIRENYRREFIGNVSHELKTPLFTVQGYIETLLDGALNDEKIREKYLKRAKKGVERLTYIIKDLDMITKLEVGELHLEKETFDIIDLIENVFESLEMKASKNLISLTFNKKYQNPIWVKADKDRIQQVLSNLIVNSIKYSINKGTTELSIENLIMNKVLIRVTDNGEGINNDQIPRLFERFYRVDKSGSREQGGSGLGLSIVKHILDAHNEKIYVESQIGIGSEFSFTLEKTE